MENGTKGSKIQTEATMLSRVSKEALGLYNLSIKSLFALFLAGKSQKDLQPPKEGL